MKQSLSISSHVLRQSIAVCLLLVLFLAGCEGFGQPTPIPPAQQTASTIAAQQKALTPPATQYPLGHRSATGIPTVAPLFNGPTPTLMPKTERETLFDDVWQTVEDNYLYTDFHGADWKALRDKYKPKAVAAKSAFEFYGLLDNMVAQLNDDHSSYETPWGVKEEDAEALGKLEYAGIGFLGMQDVDSSIVLEVYPDTPAAQAGLKRRDRVTKVDGQQITYENPGVSKIPGPEGTQVHLTVHSPGQPDREMTITRRKVKAAIEPLWYRLEADPSIGYLMIPSFTEDAMNSQVEDALGHLIYDGPGDLKGLVIDLRSNSGGTRPVMEDILSDVIIGKNGGAYTKVGTFYNHNESQSITLMRKHIYSDKLTDVPIVILVDKWTGSGAELMAAIMQNQGRARVVGARSAGNTETVYPHDFKDGSRLWLAQEGFKLPDGTSLEGRGVIPDAEIDLNWADYTEQEDPHILKAIELLKKGDK